MLKGPYALPQHRQTNLGKLAHALEDLISIAAGVVPVPRQETQTDGLGPAAGAGGLLLDAPLPGGWESVGLTATATANPEADQPPIQAADEVCA
jgi:hypothetical protein